MDSSQERTIDNVNEEDGATLPKRRRVGPGGQYCSAVGCNKSAYLHGPRGIKFYRFPKDTNRRVRWITQVNRRLPVSFGERYKVDKSQER